MNMREYDRVRFIGETGVFKDVHRGDIGYVLEDYGDGSYEVEFSEADGTTRALMAIPGEFLEVAET